MAETRLTFLITHFLLPIGNQINSYTHDICLLSYDIPKTVLRPIQNNPKVIFALWNKEIIISKINDFFYHILYIYIGPTTFCYSSIGTKYNLFLCKSCTGIYNIVNTSLSE